MKKTTIASTLMCLGLILASGSAPAEFSWRKPLRRA